MLCLGVQHYRFLSLWHKNRETRSAPPLLLRTELKRQLAAQQLNFLLVGTLQCSKMDIIKSIRTWKPLKKSKSQQSYKTTTSDSSDNYCLSEPQTCQEKQSSRTSLESESLYVNVNARPSLEPLSKPPPHFLRPKQPFQGKVNFIDLESSFTSLAKRLGIMLVNQHKGDFSTST